MPRGSEHLSLDRPWLLAIGQWLRGEYDALSEPIPERLTALLAQLQAPTERSDDGAQRAPVKRSADPAVPQMRAPKAAGRVKIKRPGRAAARNKRAG
jgi:Anti-sigma factor NepR